MASFGYENAAKRFLFSKSTLKTRKKIVMENFFLGHMGLKYGVKNGPIQKSTISLKMVENRQNWVFFIGERQKMMRIRFSTRF
jgi:hypothetical protein